jgi:heat-inducible transcriptional repressor
MEPVSVTDKAQILLKNLIEHYIAGGQPVASKHLARSVSMPMSPASVRNIMADLEDKGFLKSPHTSAGRIPTEKAYRLFVDSLIKIQPMADVDVKQLSRHLDPDMTAQELVKSASDLLSEITHLAGLVTIPRHEQVVLKHLEFLSLSGDRVLVIMVLNDHEVENRVIHSKEAYTDTQLKEISNFLNAHFVGQSLAMIRQKTVESMTSDRENMNNLMQATLNIAAKVFGTEQPADFVVAGQENLFELGQDQRLDDIRALFKAFSLKGDILHLLDRCMNSEGVQLFIGQESGYDLLDECSLVTSSYQIEGQLVGVLGVIGPTRMAYDRVIPIVDTTARILSAALELSRR